MLKMTRLGVTLISNQSEKLINTSIERIETVVNRFETMLNCFKTSIHIVTQARYFRADFTHIIFEAAETLFNFFSSLIHSVVDKFQSNLFNCRMDEILHSDINYNTLGIVCQEVLTDSTPGLEFNSNPGVESDLGKNE